jgi:hypothetical protein
MPYADSNETILRKIGQEITIMNDCVQTTVQYWSEIPHNHHNTALDVETGASLQFQNGNPALRYNCVHLAGPRFFDQIT